MLGNIKTFVKYLPYLVIIGLVIALSVTQCSKQEIKTESHEAEYQAKINAKEAELVTIQNREEELKKKLYTDSLKNSASLQSLKRENKALRKEIVTARANIQNVIDSIPEVDHFVDLTDSLDLIQEATIDTLQNQGARQWTAFNSVLSLEKEKNAVHKEINLHLESINSDLRKSVRKERNKKTFWKVATGIAVTGLIFNSLNH